MASLKTGQIDGWSLYS